MTSKAKRPRGRAGTGDGDARGAAARRDLILLEAARLFSERGFAATTTRDIAKAAGILGGSIYYHFASKEEIFLAVHTVGMEGIMRAVREAIAAHDDPWDQLEAAAAAHCEGLLASSDLPINIAPRYGEALASIQGELVAQRDAYERMIAEVIARLDLPAHVDRLVFRKTFLGALNWMPHWWRAGRGVAAAEVGRQLVACLRPR